MNTHPNPPEDSSAVNRRDFLRGGSVATLMTLLGGVELKAPAQVKNAAGELIEAPKIKCGVVGLGVQGRNILNALATIPEADVAAVCDTYPAWLKRGGAAAPKATAVADYRQILDNKEIQAVLVATPTHQHRDIVLAALQAGKHVYCEAPLAATVEDARAIAKAAKAATKLVFQSGLQTRSDPQRHFLLQFIRSGATGKTVAARAQSHKKHPWRATSPNPERERELNWRLNKEVSTGLLGEIGIHQIDAAAWFMKARPIAVSAFGGVLHWNDGREVADTVQAVFEFPGGVTFAYDCALTNSFDGDYDMLFGTDAAVMMRGNKAWMFKEVDSPLLGWEVYARKDTFYKETGIALVANATKLAAQGDNPLEDAPYANSTLNYALTSFLTNVGEVGSAVEDFIATFGAGDAKALEKHLATVARQPAAGYLEGYEATVLAIKANEALVKRERIALQKEWFDLV